MINAEKIIKQLELQLDDLQKYAADGELLTLTQEQAKEIIALLKEQEPKHVIDMTEFAEGMKVGRCPSCARSFVNLNTDETKFCKSCGQAVKWK